MKWIFELTAHMGASSKLSRHRWIDRDHDLLLVGHNGISVLYLLCNPIFEVLSDDGSTDINNPLLRDLCQIGLVGEIVFNILHL